MSGWWKNRDGFYIQKYKWCRPPVCPWRVEDPEALHELFAKNQFVGINSSQEGMPVCVQFNADELAGKWT